MSELPTLWTDCPALHTNCDGIWLGKGRESCARLPYCGVGRNGHGVDKTTWFQHSWDSGDMLWLGWPSGPPGFLVPSSLHSCSALVLLEQHMHRHFPMWIWSTVKATHPTHSRAPGEQREGGWLQLCTHHCHFCPRPWHRLVPPQSFLIVGKSSAQFPDYPG